MTLILLKKFLGKPLIISALLNLFTLNSAIPAVSRSHLETTSRFKKPSNKIKLKNKVRTKAVQNLDDFLNWTIPQQRRTYILNDLEEASVYRIDLSQVHDFIQWHGYFSAHDPLVGRVSKRKGDLSVAQSLLTYLGQEITDPKSRKFAIDEALVKVMAYRDLKIDDSFDVVMEDRDGIPRLMTYRVDHVFNLWHGMPAFGLVAEEEEEAILLFRGTDFSLSSERGWASLVSDVDLAGPGFTAFMHARKEIRSWLQKVACPTTRARVMGFSLGGVLAAYTFLYENEWVSLEGCIAFNPPGFSERVLQDWNRLSPQQQEAFTVYVNRGDPVSKIGRLFGRAYEVSVNKKVTPLRAHTLFLTAESEFSCIPIHLERENQTR
jgi:hypothetical protein